MYNTKLVREVGGGSQVLFCLLRELQHNSGVRRGDSMKNGAAGLGDYKWITTQVPRNGL